MQSHNTVLASEAAGQPDQPQPIARSGTFTLSFDEYRGALLDRVPNIEQDLLNDLAASYHNYSEQATKLEIEVSQLNDSIDTSQERHVLGEELDLELFGPPATADDVDITKAMASFKTIRDMLAVCLDRLRILMTGEVDDLNRLLETDAAEDLTVDRMYAADEDIREHVDEGWKHLDQWERSLRLRLIHAVIAKEAIMEAQMSDLADAFGEMKVEELVNEDVWDDDALALLEALNQAQDELDMERKLKTLRLA
jgi:hypothetical protein